MYVVCVHVVCVHVVVCMWLCVRGCVYVVVCICISWIPCLCACVCKVLTKQTTYDSPPLFLRIQKLSQLRTYLLKGLDFQYNTTIHTNTPNLCNVFKHICHDITHNVDLLSKNSLLFFEQKQTDKTTKKTEIDIIKQ